MPLEQRVIQPIWVSRGCFELNQHHPHHIQGTSQQVNVANELECVTNGTLSNIIRQLSSLSRHAEDLFGSLLQETTGLVQRSVNLKQRLDILTDKVERLSDSGPDQPVGTYGKKPFRSRADNFDQQIVARTTIPVSLKEVYERCDPPPCLSKLNPFRDDDMDGLKLYTNPNYFFELWRKEMLAGKGKTSKKDAHSSSAKKSKSRSSNSRHQSVDAGQSLPGNVHYHVQQPQQQHSPHLQNHNPHHPQAQMIINQGPNSRSSLASGDMPYGVYGESNGSIAQQQAYAVQQQQQQQQKIYGQHPAQSQAQNQHIYGYQGQMVPGSYDQTGYNEQNNAYNQQYGQQNRPNSLELSQQQQQQQQQQYYSSMDYYKQQQQQQQQYGVYGTNPQPIYGQNNQYQGQQQSPNQLGTPTKRGGGVSRPSVAPPAPPPGAGSQPSTPIKNRIMNGNDGSGNIASRESLPPPPPPPPMDDMPPPPPMSVGSVSGGAPPPPPPPPMPSDNAGFAPPPPPPPPPPASTNNGPSMPAEAPKKPAASGNLAKPTAEMLQSVKLKKTEPKSNNGVEDNRSNLLAAIRQGIKLKRVEETRKEVEKSAPLHDVASILARRVAMEMSDSEGEGKNDDDEESDGWDVDSE